MSSSDWHTSQVLAEKVVREILTAQVAKKSQGEETTLREEIKKLAEELDLDPDELETYFLNNLGLVDGAMAIHSHEWAVHNHQA